MNDIRLKLCSEREIRWEMKKSKISETGEAMPPMDKKYIGNFAKKEQNLWNWRGTPTKIDVHACYINAYLPEFFELILIN